jgi:aldose sugar dehydrogenase
MRLRRFASYAVISWLCVGSISACSSSDSGGGVPQPTPSAGTVTISGSVSGTIIKVVHATTNAILAQTDTASQTGPPPFAFSLTNLPIGAPIKVYFFSAGQTFPLVIDNPTTNVFTIQSSGVLDLGFVTLSMSGMNAIPEHQPASVLPGQPDAAVPPGITPPPATLSITTPAAGEVIVSFNVQNFAIGGEGQQHVHIRIGSGPIRHFYNGLTSAVKEDSGVTSAEVAWQSVNAFRLNLPVGTYTITVWLVTATHTQFANSEANPPSITVTITSPPPPPPPPVATIAVTSGNTFLSSPVRISFSVSNFTIGLPGTPHMRLSIDGGPQNDFYNGNGITSDNGVLLNGVHNHAVHWTSPNTFDLFGLTAAAHSVRLALVDALNSEVASTTHNFTVQQPPTGELQLQSVLDGVIFPSALAQASDGRIFFNERLTGNVRVVNVVGGTWQLDPTPFCPTPLSISASGEQGLLGLALDPNFSTNQSLYVYYTRAGFTNRVSKLTKAAGVCTETAILDGLPTAGNHNGGIIQFGPDGRLYVVIGDAGNPDAAQSLDSLAGKILRINSNGSADIGNPFYNDGTGNRDKVYSLGHRNSFGFTFHSQTGDLWESENGLSDFDEVNRVVSGGNYGWDSSLQSGFLNRPCCRNPILALPIIAPTGIVTVPGSSTIYPSAYRNNLLMASFNDGAIRLVIPNAANPDQPGTASVAFPGGKGGLVGMMVGNDGYVYVTNHNFGTFNGSSIFRVVPH